MRDIFTVVKFTMKDMVKRKSFIISTLIILTFIVVGFNVPNLIKSFNGDNSGDKLLIIDSKNVFEGTLENLKQMDLGYEFEITNEDLKFEDVKKKIENEEIKEAIIIYPKLKFANKNIMDLYAIIAEYHNVTSGSVEKAIRHLLERTWYCENINLSHVIFDCPYINADDVQKNSVFISTMAEILKYQLKNNQIISNTEILRC